MRIIERYASAIRSSNLTVDERTTYSDPDVLGAMGLAAKEHELSVALERLFCGDNHASFQIVAILAEMLRGKAPMMRENVTEAQAVDMAKACMAWHRDGKCRPCGGHGLLLIPGTKVLGNVSCKACKGTGTREFEKEFHPSKRPLAQWLVAEMERAQGRAGGAAMAKIATTLDF